MANIMRPTLDVSEIPGLVELLVAQGIAQGMSKEDVRVWLGSLASEEYVRQVSELSR